MSFPWALYTPRDNVGKFNIFKSAYKNIRFQLQPSSRYMVTQPDMANLPGIAYKLYNDVGYWRVILAVNGLSDAINDIYPGLVLDIPSKSDVIAYMSRQQDNVATINNVSI